MTAPKNLALAALLSFLILNVFSDASSQADCCLRHTKSILPFRIIIGFKEQHAHEICDIDAIVFYTHKGKAICANPKTQWVKRTLKLLSKRLEIMSQN